jgi:hypothetical protein
MFHGASSLAAEAHGVQLSLTRNRCAAQGSPANELQATTAEPRARRPGMRAAWRSSGGVKTCDNIIEHLKTLLEC